MSLHVGLRLFGLDVLTLDVNTDTDEDETEDEDDDHGAVGVELRVNRVELPDRDGGPCEVFAQGRRP